MPLAPRWKLYDTNIQHIGKKRMRKKQSIAFSYRHLHDPALVCPGGGMPWLVPRSSYTNFVSGSWRIFGYDKIFCAHMHTADATDCLQNQHSHLIDSLCTLLSAAKSPTNTIAARTMIFGHSGLSILRLSLIHI